jgi:hypothetical protein
MASLAYDRCLGRTRLRSLSRLEQLVLQSHVSLRFKTDTSTEDISQSTSLFGKGIDNRCSRWSQRSLKHVTENAEHAVEALEVLRGSTICGLSFPGDTRHHLCNEHKINDEWRSQQGVLTDVEKPDLSATSPIGRTVNLRDRLMATHEDLSVILVQGTLIITNGWHILDHNGMIWMLAFLV